MIVDNKSVITNNKHHLVDVIDDIFSTSRSIDIIVSFLKESGLSLIDNALVSALDRGVHVRILTGTYLGITSPFALEELISLKGKVEIRLFSEDSVAFHPKAYIIHSMDPKDDCVIVGSSNISASALTDGVEWNYRLLREMDPISFLSFQEEFDYLFSERSRPLTTDVLKEYRNNWKRPSIKIPDNFNGMIPEGPQISALNSLTRTRSEGMDKALIVAATGVGKTFIAAKDSEHFNRILFVAHRKEILIQAANTFKRVHRGKSCGFLMTGFCDMESDMLFASIRSLANPNVLKEIPPDSFDYIVIDEFHHAVTDGYRTIFNHFTPKFLLGLTATPERMDHRDVFILCDYNVPFEIGLSDAIRFGRLVPFTYHGIADDTDYDNIRFSNGRYSREDLETSLSDMKRADLILSHFMKYHSERAIGFCSGIRHAEFMKDYFESHGIPSRAIVSGGDDDRIASVEDFEGGKVRVLFTVDMFNEGVDIPSIDLVMFLRPTESQTVFTQQLGRGLRRSDGKERLTVLDFIGNYRNVDRIPEMLTGVRGIGTDPRTISDKTPCDCVIDFDLISINIMRKMSERDMTWSARVDSEFDRIKNALGRVPTRMELFSEMDESIIYRSRLKGGIFKDYLGYLHRRGLATPMEESIINTVASDFINLIENTSMSRLYKMPLLLSFIDGDHMVLSAGWKDIARSFREFYANRSNRADIKDLKHFERYDEIPDSKWISLAKNNPVHFLMKGSPRFFRSDDEGLHLSDNLADYVSLRFFTEHVRDAICFRVIDFKRARYIDHDE
ncbi:MAG: DEAD/DEAH box helicase family protein [Candidatus Methanomethylophilaceae archaeon]|nr:DEAD/DEAH box helicase family protein [Candidatus Methanomethylophilaceae archaeon]